MIWCGGCSVADTALGAVYSALRKRLASADPLWGTRVFADEVPPNTPHPYLVYWVMAYTEPNRLRTPDALLAVGVKVVARSFEDANAGALRIGQLLNDNGGLDSAPTIMYANGWHVQTITQTTGLFMSELREDGLRLYHHGYQFEFRLQKA
jgi:hypothetical protein